MNSLAIPYVRFSTDQQADGSSVDRQIAAIEKFAAVHDLDLAPPRIDRGESGFKGHHRLPDRELGKFEAEAADGLHDGTVLVVENLDRLTRQGSEAALELIIRLRRQGVSLAIVSMNRILFAHEPLALDAMILTTVDGERAQGESKRKVALNTGAWDARRRAAKENGTILHFAPAWLKGKAGEKARIDQKRADMVRRFYEMADSGMGCLTIAKTVNREGVKAWARNGRQPLVWCRRFIQTILCNREVLGEFQPKQNNKPCGEAWIGHYPAIVDADLFARVQRNRPIRQKVKGGRTKLVIANVFSSMTKCAACGTSMAYQIGNRTAKNPQRFGILICRTRQRGGQCQMNAHWHYHHLESGILDSCLHLAMDAKSFSNRGEVHRLNVLIAERGDELERLSAKRKRMMLAFEDDDSDALDLIRDLKNESDSLGQNLDALRQQRDTAEGRSDSAEHIRRLRDIRVKMASADFDERKIIRLKVAQAMAGLIERIDLDPDKAVVRLAGNAGALYFNRAGKLTRGFDLLKGQGGDDLADYRKRLATAQKAGKSPFGNEVKRAV